MRSQVIEKPLLTRKPSKLSFSRTRLIVLSCLLSLSSADSVAYSSIASCFPSSPSSSSYSTRWWVNAWWTSAERHNCECQHAQDDLLVWLRSQRPLWLAMKSRPCLRKRRKRPCDLSLFRPQAYIFGEIAANHILQRIPCQSCKIWWPKRQHNRACSMLPKFNGFFFSSCRILAYGCFKISGTLCVHLVC